MSRVDLLTGFARKLEPLDPELAKECRAIMNTIVEEDMERAKRLSAHRDPLVAVLRQLGNEVGIIKDDIARPGHARIGDWLCRPCDRWFGTPFGCARIASSSARFAAPRPWTWSKR